MSLLYKRSNRFWHFLIRHRMTHAVWRPLVEWNRVRHQAFRRRLAARPVPGMDETPASGLRAGTVLSAGV